jgi:hypothetical protein
MIMSVALASPAPSFSERLFRVIEKLDYRIAVDDESRDAVFQLRYHAYERENIIAPTFSQRLSDRFDDLDNTMIVAIYLDGRIAATIRISVMTMDYPEGPDLPPFRDVVQPMIDQGQIIIDPTRHATDEAFSSAYPGLMPYLTTRVAWMAAEYFGADQILASVRIEHQAFYKRVFGCRLICEARPYPPLLKPLSLMTLDFKAERDKVLRRYPTFRSTLFEQRMLFQPGLPADIGRSGHAAAREAQAAVTA